MELKGGVLRQMLPCSRTTFISPFSLSSLSSVSHFLSALLSLITGTAASTAQHTPHFLVIPLFLDTSTSSAREQTMI